jgi:hypothetical protein
VKWADESRQFRTLDGTRCFAGRGDRVGFERGDDGRLVAFAGQERIRLEDRLPNQARYCVWYTRQERQTQFGKEVSKALTTTGQIAEVAAGAALLTGVVVLDAYLESKDDDDDCFEFSSRGHKRDRHKHHHKSPATRPAK